MQTVETKAEIINLENFRQQKQLANEAPASTVPGFTPMLMWYPVWVMVPDQPSTPAS